MKLNNRNDNDENGHRNVCHENTIYGYKKIQKLSGGGLVSVFPSYSGITATVQVYNDYEKREYFGA